MFELRCDKRGSAYFAKISFFSLGVSYISRIINVEIFNFFNEHVIVKVVMVQAYYRIVMIVGFPPLLLHAIRTFK